MASGSSLVRPKQAPKPPYVLLSPGTTRRSASGRCVHVCFRLGKASVRVSAPDACTDRPTRAPNLETAGARLRHESGSGSGVTTPAVRPLLGMAVPPGRRVGPLGGPLWRPLWSCTRSASARLALGAAGSLPRSQPQMHEAEHGRRRPIPAHPSRTRRSRRLRSRAVVGRVRSARRGCRAVPLVGDPKRAAKDFAALDRRSVRQCCRGLHGRARATGWRARRRGPPASRESSSRSRLRWRRVRSRPARG